MAHQLEAAEFGSNGFGDSTRSAHHYRPKGSAPNTRPFIWIELFNGTEKLTQPTHIATMAWIGAN
jgi:hypothetical protein